MLVDREVETDAGDQLIRAIQQHEIAARTLRVAIQDVTDVCGKVDVLAKTSVDNADKTKVADVAARACAALHLIEAGEIVSLVWIPAIERNHSDSERIVWTGEPDLRARYEVVEAAL